MTSGRGSDRRRPDEPRPTPAPQPEAEDEVSLGDESGSLALRPGPGGKITADDVRRVFEAVDDSGEEGEASLRRVVFRLQRDLQKRLDRYLTDRITFMSRTQLQRLIDEGGVTVNQRRPKASTLLRLGDEVAVVVPPPPPKNVQPEDIPLDVLFEDEHLIVLNKQPDIIVHPARTHLKGTLLSALEFHFRHRSPVGGSLSKVGDEFARPGVVHRLDRHTSGCIVFAKSDEAHWKLARQFELREVEKRYLAVTHGLLEPEADAIELPIGPHPSREKGYREKYVVRHDHLGKYALTIYRVRELYGERRPPGDDGVPSGFSLVELELRTGRTHQIRVHLSELGFPIVGDDMYGGKPFPAPDGSPILSRQALHAALLGFRHPITGVALEFTAPLRGDIGALLAALRARGPVVRTAVPGVRIDLDRAHFSPGP